MDCQDWNNITFNSKSQKVKTEQTKEVQKTISQKQTDPETTRLEAPKQLGQIISQARTAKGKNQKQMAGELEISPQIYGRWESNKETPTNAQLANIEKKLGVKLPRCKKVSVKDV